ncbi:hypothetical protein M758_12G115700 [Ceratodon purpureus]|nr:hypothetical protein M758_12G115700 [Ceratodon purpureus]
MAALGVASVSSKCFVSLQETTPWPCHWGGYQRFRPSAARLTTFQRECTLNALRPWERRSLAKDKVVMAFSSQHNLSATDLSDDAVAEDLSPNYDLELMSKADEVRDDLHGTCIYLIGLLDSRKAFIGKTLAKELGYYFFDSNDLVQQAAGEAEISEGEEGYSEAETEVLKQLSAVGRLVVSTGAGTVAKSENWGFLRHGIVIWIDMPVETVAKDAKTRQLLVPNCADDEALAKMSKLYEERKETYRNADAMVSIQALSAQLGFKSPSEITPTMTALEVLNVIGVLIKEKQAKKVRQ